MGNILEAAVSDSEGQLGRSLSPHARESAKALLAAFNGSVAEDRQAFHAGYRGWCAERGIEPYPESHRMRKKRLLAQSYAYLQDPDGWPADQRLAKARAMLGGVL